MELLSCILAPISCGYFFAIAAAVLGAIYLFSGDWGLKLPPGPRGLPVVGNIFQLGENAHLSMTEMARVYGPVYKIRIGSKRVIVVNGVKEIRQALSEQSLDFVSRPEFYTSKFISGGVSVSFSTMPVEEHRRYRKILVDSLSSFALRKVKSSDGTKSMPRVESIVTEEVSDFCDRLLNSGRDENDNVIELTKIFDEIAWTTSNILSAFLFGARYKWGEDTSLSRFIDSNEQFSTVRASSSAADMMPWLRYVYPWILSKFTKIMTEQNRFIETHVKKHLDTYDDVYDWENRDKVGIEPTNVVDSLIEKARDMKSNPLYEGRRILYVVADLMGAGFDTVSKGIQWMFVYAAVFAEHQEKMQQEIDEFMKKENRSPSYSDRSEFPFTEAFMHEVLRHSCFVPFTIPHAVSRDGVRLHGYDMPKRTIVFFNQWSASRDETVWDEPEEFRPDRFLDETGRFDTDMGDQVLLFSMGKRVCPGKSLAKLEIFLYSIEILKRCKLTMHPDNPGLPKAKYGLVMSPTSGKFFAKPR